MRKPLFFALAAALFLAQPASAADVDGDRDGIPDGLDKCPFTQPNAQIDPQGCALDGDLDQVADGIDRCPGTASGETVNAEGCSSAQFPVAAAPVAPAAAGAAAPAAPAASSVFDVLSQPGAATPAPAPAAVPPPVIAPSAPAPQQPTFYTLPGDPSLPAYSPSTESAPPAALADDSFSDPLLTTVYFVRGSSQIPEASLRKLGYSLSGLKKSIDRYPRMVIELAGHADGGDKGNPGTLALARAEAVKSYLVSQGVPAERVRATSRAAEAPLGKVEVLTYPK